MPDYAPNLKRAKKDRSGGGPSVRPPAISSLKVKKALLLLAQPRDTDDLDASADASLAKRYLVDQMGWESRTTIFVRQLAKGGMTKQEDRAKDGGVGGPSKRNGGKVRVPPGAVGKPIEGSLAATIKQTVADESEFFYSRHGHASGFVDRVEDGKRQEKRSGISGAKLYRWLVEGSAPELVKMRKTGRDV